MKKTIAIIVLLALTLGLCGCGSALKEVLQSLPENSSVPSVTKPEIAIPTPQTSLPPQKETLPVNKGGGSSDTTSENNEPILPFGEADAEIMGISLFNSQDEVLSVLGLPVDTLGEYSIYTDDEEIIFYYTFGTVHFNSSGVHSISVHNHNANAIGPRGIKMGDNLAKVLSLFPIENEPTNEPELEMNLYGTNYSEERAFFYRVGTYVSVLYAYGPPGFGGVGLTCEFDGERLVSFRLFAGM